MNALNTIRPELLSFTTEQLQLVMPLFWMTLGSIVVLVLTQFKSLPVKWVGLVGSVATLALAGCSSVSLLDVPRAELFNQMLAVDGFSQYFNLLFIASALFTVLASFHYLDRENLQHPEYNVLILFSAIGMMLMTSATDLVVLFVAIEIMSLSVYSLVGFRRNDKFSNEAAMKYFILGGAASALFLYGAALVYGATGSTRVVDIVKVFQAQPMGTLGVIGSWMLIAGFLFKGAAVPFHMWMPDVYEGAPAPVTGYMTTGLKAAVFAALARVMIDAFSFGVGGFKPWTQDIYSILWGMAVLTMLVGNVLALSQPSLKRMLAYSSIAHTGYLLVGFATGMKTADAYPSIVFYLFSYVVMNLGAFVTLTFLSEKGDRGLTLQDLSGLARRRPGMAFALATFMFSMAGIPPTVGFIGKYLIFYQAVQAGEVFLVVLGVLCSAISVYYYLRVLVYMYMREPVAHGEPIRRPGFSWVSVSVAVLVLITIQVGVIPKHWVESARRAITSQ